MQRSLPWIRRWPAAFGFDLIWFGVLMMLLAVSLICVIPGIATALPDLVMGLARRANPEPAVRRGVLVTE